MELSSGNCEDENAFELILQESILKNLEGPLRRFYDYFINREIAWVIEIITLLTDWMIIYGISSYIVHFAIIVTSLYISHHYHWITFHHHRYIVTYQSSLSLDNLSPPPLHRYISPGPLHFYISLSPLHCYIITISVTSVDITTTVISLHFTTTFISLNITSTVTSLHTTSQLQRNIVTYLNDRYIFTYHNRHLYRY